MRHGSKVAAAAAAIRSFFYTRPSAPLSRISSKTPPREKRGEAGKLLQLESRNLGGKQKSPEEEEESDVPTLKCGRSGTFLNSPHAEERRGRCVQFWRLLAVARFCISLR